MEPHDFGSFAQALHESQVPAWRTFYYDYGLLVKLVSRCTDYLLDDNAAGAQHVMNGWSERSTATNPGSASERITDELILKSTPMREAETEVVKELRRQDEVVRSFFETTLDNLWAKAEPLIEQAEQMARNDGGRTCSSVRRSEQAPSVSTQAHLELTLSPAKAPKRTSAALSAGALVLADAAGATPPPPTIVIPSAARASLHTAFVQLHRSIRSLETFGVLNSTTRSKVLRMLRGAVAGYRTSAEVEACIEEAPERLDASARLLELLDRTERTYALAFYAGVLEDAKGQLLLLRSSTGAADSRAANRYEYYQVGLHVGASALAFLWLLYDLIIEVRVRQDDSCRAQLPPATGNMSTHNTPSGGLAYSLQDDPVVAVFQCVGSAVFAYWCWGVAVWMTHTARINVPYLLELSSEPSSPRKIFLQAARYTIVYCALACVRWPFARWVASLPPGRPRSLSQTALDRDRRSAGSPSSRFTTRPSFRRTACCGCTTVRCHCSCTSTSCTCSVAHAVRNASCGHSRGRACLPSCPAARASRIPSLPIGAPRSSSPSATSQRPRATF
jgi:hypothetical protein